MTLRLVIVPCPLFLLARITTRTEIFNLTTEVSMSEVKERETMMTKLATGDLHTRCVFTGHHTCLTMHTCMFAM